MLSHEKPSTFQPVESAQSDVLWETVPCNMCGSENVRVKYKGTTDHDMATLLRSYYASGNFVSKETLVQCKECDLVFTSPRLKQEVILKSYVEAEDPLYVSQADGRMLSFERCLRTIAKHQRPGRILDVGAASGFFLKVAHDKGWDTFGIEPSRYLSAYARDKFGLNVFTGTLDSAPRLGAQMDVVTLWDVLEHTFDPKDTLRRCHGYLKPGGLLVINYPNIANWMARIAGRKYWFILSVHLYYFTPKTISKLLRQTGYAVVESGPHFQWLELGYLVYRLEAYLPAVAKVMKKCVRLLRMERTLIPYFAAQTRVIARKVGET